MSFQHSRSRHRIKGKAISYVAIFILLLATGLLAVIGLRDAYRTAGQPLSVLEGLVGLIRAIKGDLQLPMDQAPFTSVPWQLKLAKLLGPVSLLLLTGSLGVSLFKNQWHRFRARFLRGHVIVCGAGQKGRRIVSQSLAEGKRVVVLEIDPTNDAIDELRAPGALVVVGNATDSTLLSKVGVEHAAELFALAGQDETNLEIAAEVHRLRHQEHGGGRNGLRLFAHVGTRRLRHVFEVLPPFSGIQDGVEARMFDTISAAAREIVGKTLAALSLHDAKDRAPTFLLYGEGMFLEELLREVSCHAHCGSGKLPRITVMTTDATLTSVFDRRYPSWRLIADIRFISIPEARFGLAEIQATSDVEEYDLAVVALQNDVLTIEAADAIARAFGSKANQLQGHPLMRAKRVVACLLPTSGLARLGSQYSKLSVEVITAAELGCKRDLILGRRIDESAQLKHKMFVLEELKKPEALRSPEAAKGWEQLTEAVRETNRSAAFHDEKVKIPALAQVGESGRPALRERLARAEHNRWMAHRILEGWVQGPRDDGARRHPSLIPYDMLSLEMQKKDRDSVDEAWKVS